MESQFIGIMPTTKSSNFRISIRNSNLYLVFTANFFTNLLRNQELLEILTLSNNRIEKVNVLGSHIQFTKSIRLNFTLTYGRSLF